MSFKSIPRTKIVIASFISLAIALLIGISCASESALANQSATAYEPTAEDLALAQSDPTQENSFRYVEGELVEAKEDNASQNDGIELFKVVSSGGYTYFDTFDTFKKGYCTGKGAYRGIDVSEHQKSINWSKVKNAGIDFVIVRCGYGSNSKSQDDKYWLENIRGCIQNGLPFGVYLYSYANSTSKAKSEANHALRCLTEAGLGPSDLAFPVYFDMEDAVTVGSNYASLAKTFCNTLAAAGYPVGVYSSTSWWSTKLTSSTFNNYHKWVAQFNTTMGLTYDGVSNFSSGNGIWQFSSMGKVSGITSNTVDLNYTYMPPNAVELMNEAYTHPAVPHPKTVENGEYVIYSQANTTMAATIKNGSAEDNANIHLGTSDMTVKQRFYIVRDPQTGFYTISGSATGKVFGLVKTGNIYLTNLAQRAPNPYDNSQKWIIQNSGNNKYVIKNAANPNFVMKLSNASASNGSNIQVGVWKGANNQKWGLASTYVNVPRSSVNVATGIYTLALSKKTSRVVEVKNAGTLNGTNIHLNAADKSAKQKFRIENDGDGYYHIRSIINGKAIAPAIGNIVPKTNVYLVAYSKKKLSQKWSISKSGGKYVFTSVANGHVLEVKSGSSKKKANIQTNHAGATTSQKFVLKKTKAKKTVKNGTHRIAMNKIPSKGIAIRGNSKANKAKTRLVDLISSKSQKFVLTYNKTTGFYTIKNKRSGKYLEITGLKCKAGKTIRQAKKSNSYAQKWIIAKAAKGKYIIKSALNPQYVIDGGKTIAKPNKVATLQKRVKSRIQIWRM